MGGQLGDNEDPLNFQEATFGRPQSPQWISGDDMESDCTISATSSPPRSPEEEYPSTPDATEDSSVEIKKEYSFDNNPSLFNDTETSNLFNIGHLGVKVEANVSTTASERRQ